MESKYTPGPWLVTDKEHGREKRIMAKGGLVATLHNYGTAEHSPVALFIEELSANARLISAAPELLAACEAVARAVSDGGISGADLVGIAVEKCREAIRKAKGE